MKFYELGFVMIIKRLNFFVTKEFKENPNPKKLLYEQ
jgi:hypothetical protein